MKYGIQATTPWKLTDSRLDPLSGALEHRNQVLLFYPVDLPTQHYYYFVQGCCDGGQRIRFRKQGGSWKTLSITNAEVFPPQPSAWSISPAFGSHSHSNESGLCSWNNSSYHPTGAPTTMRNRCFRQLSELLCYPSRLICSSTAPFVTIRTFVDCVLFVKDCRDSFDISNFKCFSGPTKGGYSATIQGAKSNVLLTY